MPRMKVQRTPERIADEIRSWAESAVYDVAMSQDALGELENYDCLDKSGAAADDMYNDPSAMSDLLGDKIYEESHGDDDLRNKIIDALKNKMSHLPEDLWDDLRSR